MIVRTYIRRFYHGKIALFVLISVSSMIIATFFLFLAFKYGRVPVLLDFTKCNVCPHIKQAYKDSRPEDLILLGVFGDIEKVKIFIKSLRAVGCTAHIVIVTNTTYNEEIRKILGHCGVEFFRMHVPKNATHHAPHSLRYIGYRQFLESTNRQFYRIFHSDSFDVFFQSDPFTEQIYPDSLYFIMEDILIKDSTWNTGWLKRAYNSTISEQFGNFTVSCSGTVIGGADQFKRYLNTLLSHQEFWKNGRHSLDQAYHNYLLHSGEFERAGIKRKEFGCNSPFLTLHYCSRYDEQDYFDDVICPDGHTKPAVVHQYNINFKAKSLIESKCSSK